MVEIHYQTLSAEWLRSLPAGRFGGSATEPAGPFFQLIHSIHTHMYASIFVAIIQVWKWHVCRRSWVSLAEKECRTHRICSHLNLAKTINQRLQQRQLRYFRHVVRMKDTRYPKLSLYGYMHGSKNVLADRVKEDWVEMGMNILEATICGQDCQLWRESKELLLRAWKGIANKSTQITPGLSDSGNLVIP